MQAGSLGRKATKLFIDESYKKRPEPVGKFQIDKELSTNRSKVYVNPSGKVVVSHQGSKGVKDWVYNNPALLLGQYKKTDRYKDIKAVQKAVNKKYGIDNVETVSHSQTGQASRQLSKEGLTKSGQSQTLNPAIIGRKPKGLKVYKSSGDIVSALTKTGKRDEVIPATSLNPIIQHGTSILGAGEFDFEPKRYM
jgi:hypothetical protein